MKRIQLLVLCLSAASVFIASCASNPATGGKNVVMGTMEGEKKTTQKHHQEIVKALDQMRVGKQRGTAVQKILPRVAECRHHRVRVVPIAETVQVEDAAKSNNADTKRTGHRKQLLSSNPGR